MSISPISSPTNVAEPAWARDLSTPMGMPTARGVPAKPSAADVKKAAGQFEAIIVRQLLAPSIEPMMSGGMGGKESSSAGGGVYGYMMTDVLAGKITAGGGMGLSRMLEKQLSPKAPASSSESLSSDSKPDSL